MKPQDQSIVYIYFCGEFRSGGGIKGSKDKALDLPAWILGSGA